MSVQSAPSVTIAPRRIAGRLVFYVTLLTGAGPSAYPCRTEQAAFKLATRFVHAASSAATRSQVAPTSAPAPAPAA